MLERFTQQLLEVHEVRETTMGTFVDNGLWSKLPLSPAHVQSVEGESSRARR